METLGRTRSQTLQRGSPSVCAIVVNSVSHDARVLKEADSLAAAGYDVTIVGVRDARNAIPEERRDSGVRIVRVAWRAAAYRRLTIAVAVFALALVVGLVGLPFVLPYVWVGDALGFLADRYFVPVIFYGLAFVAAYYASRRVRSLLRASRHFSSIEEHGPEGEQTAGLGRRLRVAVASRYRTFNWIGPIASVVLEVQPDVVHCHDVYTLPIGAHLKKKMNCQLVYDAHEIYEAVAQNDAEVGAIHRQTQRRHLPLVDGFITINDSIARFYADHYSLPEPVVVKNATLQAGRIAYDRRLHDAAGLPPDQRILLYQGGFSPKRGLEILVTSAAYLPPEWTLVMMGWGNLEEELRESASTIDGTTRRPIPPIVFVPPAPQHELALWTAGASIGVIPYENVGLNHWFCTPNKLWEYPNAGVPMLVSPFPEMTRVIETYGVGWQLPDPLDPAAISRLLRQITEEDLTEAQTACSSFVAEDNWDRYAERLLALYASLARAAGRPQVGATQELEQH